MLRSKENEIMQNKSDIVGEKFGRLTVLKYNHSNKNYIKYYLCKCECGNEIVTRKSNLLNGKTKSCGCLQHDITSRRCYIHGLSKSRTYRIWKNMKQRCYNPKASRYENYGGRGIKVCDEWLNDFMNFYNWAMANGYRDELSIDRIDVDGNYEPSNCRWVTNKKQQNNKEKNRLVTYKGVTHSVSEWADILGVGWTTLRARLDSPNYTLEECFEKPFRKYRERKKL